MDVGIHINMPIAFRMKYVVATSTYGQKESPAYETKLFTLAVCLNHMIPIWILDSPTFFIIIIIAVILEP